VVQGGFGPKYADQGLQVGGTVFQNSIKREILRHPSIAANAGIWAAEASALAQTIKEMAPGVAKDDLLTSYADALIVVWLVATGLAAVGLITSLWTKHYDLNRELETDQGFRHQEKEMQAEA
jgi:hypothetical protein